MIIVPILGAVFLVMLMAGGVRLLMLRGETTVRRGREVAQEMFEERMAREALHDDKTRIASKAYAAGTGIAFERHAFVSHGEVKAAWRDGRWGLFVLASMVYFGLLGTAYCAAFTIIFMTPWPLFGVVFLGFAVVGTVQTARWFWQAEPDPPEKSPDSKP